MMNHDHCEIQELAYYLWIAEGKPNGQSSRHWELAIKTLEKNGSAEKRSIDPSERKGTTEPEQPDQT